MRDGLLAAALNYAARGWYVFPLRPAREGAELAKVPLAGLPWRSASTVDGAQIIRWWSADDYGVGLDCGKSNLFVVDVDMHGDKNGYLVLDSLALPESYRVRTPSGGLHIYLAADASLGLGNDNRGKLGVGVDFRGVGGYVVAPPTIVPGGRYLSDDRDLPVAPVPDHIAALALAGNDRDDADPRPTVERTGAVPTGYAASALHGLISDYENADAGSGNHALFSALCRGVELANASWCDLDQDTMLFELDQARARRGRQSDREWSATLHSAFKRVGSRAASQPAERPDFRVNGVPMNSDGPGQSASTAQGTGATVPPSVPGEREANDSTELLSLDDLDGLPRPAGLIRSWLQLDSIAQIYGPPGSMKSFVALDLAAHVALGWRWYGYHVRQADVVYVAAEGTTGLGNRVKAWRQVHAITPGRLMVLPRPVQIVADEWWQFVQAMAERRPGLIILDTQARMTVGVDESSSRDMGVVIERVEALRRATGACVLIVHHTGKDDERGARGSSAQLGAMTTVLRVAKNDDTVTLSSTKEKESADNMIIDFRFQVVNLDTVDEWGFADTSLVLRQAGREELAEQRVSELGMCKLRIAAIFSRFYSDTEAVTRATIFGHLGRIGYDYSSNVKRKPWRTIAMDAWMDLVRDDVLAQRGQSQGFVFNGPNGRTLLSTYNGDPLELRSAEGAPEDQQPRSVAGGVRY